jgi:septum formation protein
LIYLASTSPRRKRLLKEAGIRFRVLRPEYHEKNIPGLGPGALVKRHALEKGLSAAKLIKDGVVLSADTVVYLNGRVIGKPRNRRDAFRILSNLEGRWHTVYTGVSLLERSAGKTIKKRSFIVKTGVQIKEMTPEEIRAYFKKINPLDKAGAYAIQSSRVSIVKKIRGSFSNAVGLPMEKLKPVFSFFNILC